MHSDFVQKMIVVLDWVGTFAFALSGALVGIHKRFDLFGILFLSFVVAVVGGMMRDVLIGAFPPVAITEIHYFFISMITGLITFYWFRVVESRQRQILLLDAIGLGLFAVIGAQKAIDHGINPLMAAILGMMTGIGGGMTRDVLAGNVPFVLKGDLYALAALAGGAVVSLGGVMGVKPTYPMLLGALVCIFLRLMAIFYNWRAPLPRIRNEKEKMREDMSQRIVS